MGPSGLRIAGKPRDREPVRRFFFIAMAFVAGYLAGAFGGGFLMSILSSNTHDRGMEAAMTGAFVLGPLAAVISAVAVFLAGWGAMRG